MSIGHCYSQEQICTAGMHQNNVSWSIGELVNESGSTGSMLVYQGFNKRSEGIISAVPEVINLNFSFYPNPVVNKLKLNFTDNNSYSWTLTDIVGRVIKTRTSCIDKEIDMSDFDAGQYILKVTADSYNRSVIIIKK